MCKIQKKLPASKHTRISGNSRKKTDLQYDMPKPARSQALGYVKESLPDTSRSAPFGVLSHPPIQAKPDPQPEQAPDPDKDRFFSTLAGIITDHIAAAVFDSSLLAQSYPGLPDSIKTELASNENVNTLISKILSTNTTGVGNPNNINSIYNSSGYARYTKDYGRKTINDRVIDAFNRLNTPITQTLNDILFWTQHYNTTEVTKIILTDSDLHYRGIGVCIVEYNSTSGAQKIVVKPEDKSFEKIVYGTEDDSLANRFNVLLSDGALGRDFTQGSIGTLDIQTSDDNSRGSAMAFFEHQRFIDLVQQGVISGIDQSSVKSLIAFSSLLGLADLHVENAVYSKTPGEKGFSIQLIDAEIGMKYLLRSDKDFALLQTVMHSGEMLDSQTLHSQEPHPNDSIALAPVRHQEFENYDPEKLSAFLDSAKEKLSKIRTRIVLLSTQQLFKYRTEFLEGYVESPPYGSALRNAIINYYPNSDLTAQELCTEAEYEGYAKKDFMAGRIPFFELFFETGEVCQIFPDEICHLATYRSSDGTLFLDYMINNRKDALAQEHALVLANQQRLRKRNWTIGSVILACAAGGAFLYLYFKK